MSQSNAVVRTPACEAGLTDNVKSANGFASPRTVRGRRRLIEREPLVQAFCGDRRDDARAPRRVAIGEFVIEACAFPEPGSVRLQAGVWTILLVVPLAGRFEIVAEGFEGAIEPGAAALLARPGASTLTWSQGSRGAILNLSRQRVQACASRMLGDPRRVAPINMAIGPLERGCGLVSMLRTETSGAPADLKALSPMVAKAVVEALAWRSGGRNPLPIAQSVKRVIDYVMAPGPGEKDLSLERLTTVSGIAERTLRDNFRAVLGVSLPTYVREARLEWAHMRLASARDGRPISEFAVAAGFKNVGGFVRAYQRTYGETPTETRVRAVRSAGKP